MKPVSLETSRIRSNWYADIVRDWNPDPGFIEHLKRKIAKQEYLAPIVVARDADHDGYVIVNGHHRFYAHLALGAERIKALVIGGTFEETEPLRKAERILKEYDEATGYRYQFSGYLDRWAAAADGERHINDYRPSVLRKGAARLWALAKRCLRKLSGAPLGRRRSWGG